MPVFRHRLLPIALIAIPLLSALGGAGGTRAAEHAVPSVQIMQSHPSLFGQLAGGQAVFVRLAYSSEQPVRFRIEGYSAGERVTESRSNPTPRYPAGAGEALVWLAFDPPVAPADPVTPVTIINAPKAEARATATATATVTANWRAAFDACEHADDPEEATKLLREIQEALDATGPVDGFREKLGRLLGMGSHFFLQVLPVLLDYADRLKDLLMRT